MTTGLCYFLEIRELNELKIHEALRSQQREQEKITNTIKEEENQKIFQKIKRKSAPGPDNITWYHIENILEMIIPKLSEYFSIMLADGTSLAHMKYSKIIPIPKPQNKGVRYIIMNFFGKLVERILHKRPERGNG